MAEAEADGIRTRFEKLAPFLDERMRRLVAASESLAIGFGGTSQVSRQTGVSRRAIIRGIKELDEAPSVQGGRIRRPGGGRKRTVDKDASLKTTELLITADCGGSNGSRVRLWKVELQRLAAETGLELRVCHLPPGTSKWNKIEHRLFSCISQNCGGQPLVSHQVIVDPIAATSTKTGLKVRAQIDSNLYPSGLKVSDKQVAALHIERDAFHGEWNYKILPQVSVN